MNRLPMKLLWESYVESKHDYWRVVDATAGDVHDASALASDQAYDDEDD